MNYESGSVKSHAATRWTYFSSLQAANESRGGRLIFHTSIK